MSAATVIRRRATTVLERVKTLPRIIRFAPEKEDAVLAFVHEKYATREWEWIRGAYSRGLNGKCLYQAITDAQILLGTDYSARPFEKVLDLVVGGSDADAIQTWNDCVAERREDVLDVLERAILGVRRR